MVADDNPPTRCREAKKTKCNGFIEERKREKNKCGK
jgi:hypothetical protein